MYKKGSGSVNMQLIRAINKSNKSNNNNNNGSANQTSSNNSTTNKVVIVAPPTTQQQSVSQNNNNSASIVPQPSLSQSSSGSPSVLPPLKKRTTIVKQAVPPPPPPRKSSPAPPARSKSNNHKSSSYCTSRIIVNVDRLQCLSEMTVQCGNLKVKKWLESVELHNNDNNINNGNSIDETSIPDEVPFKSVKKLIESFTIKDDFDKKIVPPRGKRKVSDSSVVKFHVEGYNTLDRKVRNQSVNMFKSETDSGIEISSKPTSLLKFHHQFSRDGEFV